MRRPALGAAFAALGLVATAGPSSSVQNDSKPEGAAPSSSWVYPELVAGIARRREKEANLRSYVARVGPALAALRDRVEACQAAAGTPSAASGSGRRCQAELRDWSDAVARVERETDDLTWGSVEAQGRRVQFSREFGCAGWTQEAIDIIKEHSPLVEIGAGNGQWAAALTSAGADIVAYDDFSALPLPHRPGERTAILRGNESVLSGWRLLLRYEVSLSVCLCVISDPISPLLTLSLSVCLSLSVPGRGRCWWCIRRGTCCSGACAGTGGACSSSWARGGEG